MTDRELLEDAAKAAGYRLEWHIPKAGSDEPHIEGIDWDPLTDDGDAFRLAVKLGIQIDPRAPETRVFAPVGERVDEYHKPDPLAATRRAIVRAAAEIARSKE